MQLCRDRWWLIGSLLNRLCRLAVIRRSGFARRHRQIDFPRLEDAGFGQDETDDIQFLTTCAGQGEVRRAQLELIELA